MDNKNSFGMIKNPLSREYSSYRVLILCIKDYQKNSTLISTNYSDNTKQSNISAQNAAVHEEKYYQQVCNDLNLPVTCNMETSSY